MVIARFPQIRGTWPTLRGPTSQRRSYSKDTPSKPASAHAQWYRDTVPAMIPIFLLGSVIYLGLQLAQQKLSHEKFMEEASIHVKALETEVDALQEQKLAEQSQNAVPVDGETKIKNSSWW